MIRLDLRTADLRGPVPILHGENGAALERLTGYVTSGVCVHNLCMCLMH